ncbi:Arabinose import ATP-binding protein AraG [Microbacterium oxydans]|uniref:Arabinose import ATP-binding protein AraG n=1 Tax=Microbacterium oxydans TaxID=82380 RepID=A0A0F0KUP9_9MICO|nr:ATP-binding cassette domain-containing protein [Microbacterium oxydans]KJL22966.1 Arabinose import ATP-binding protein AraG [Microbacterium oxydans]
MTPTLRLDRVGVRRRGRVILHDISMECQQGTVTSLHGSNGAGKSTLLGVATGLMEPSWGTVQNRSASTSYLPERFNPPSGMSVATYMNWVAGTRGLQRRARYRAVSTTLDSLGFTGPWGPLRLLSKGNLQRVGIASALIGATGLIVLDEPFTGLDAAGTDLVTRAIEDARAMGSTLLVVHHGAAPFAASQSLWLEEGKLTPRSPIRYVIHALTNDSLPALPDTTMVMPASMGRAVINSASDTVEATLRAILSAGWVVEGVERE